MSTQRLARSDTIAARPRFVTVVLLIGGRASFKGGSMETYVVSAIAVIGIVCVGIPAIIRALKDYES